MLLLSLLVLLAHSVYGDLSLHMLNDASEDAVCLDGSKPAIYVRPGTGSGIHSFVLHIQGGGWCFTPDECLLRSATNLGSTNGYPSVVGDRGGVMDGAPTRNPDFYNWNAVFLAYCDGCSFAGNVSGPITVNGTKLYMRGAAILDAMLVYLQKNLNFNKADRVLLTGCSAGGLATFMHSNTIQQAAPSNATFRTMSEAGFFADASNALGLPIYPTEMKAVYEMQQPVLPAECLKKNYKEPWNCMFAHYLQPYVKAPLYILNSLYDSWQMGNVLGASLYEYGNCMGPHFYRHCTSSLMSINNDYRTALLKSMKDDMVQGGAFLHSCISHCSDGAHVNPLWNTVVISGTTMQQAFSNWYFEQQGNHWKVGCAMSTTAPYVCNPTCPLE